MPEGRFPYAVMSTPGARASELRAEVLNVVLPRSPEVVCILAPSNNLGRPIAEAAADFGQFLHTVCSRWPNVVVLDFPPRLNVELAQQDLLRQEYNRVAALMGIRYLSVAGHFPLSHLHLWCRDGVHLSDSDGMPVLAQLLWAAVNLRLERTAPPAPAAPRSSRPARVFRPKVVVKGEVTAPQPSNPFDWTLVGKAKESNSVVDSEVTCGPTGWMGTLQCNIPLNPLRFSPPMLKAMDKLVPSHLPSPEDYPVVAKDQKTSTEGRRRRRRPAPNRTRRERQPEERPAPAELPSRPSSPSRPEEVVGTEDIASCSGMPPQHIVAAGTEEDSAVGLARRTLTMRATHSQMDERYSSFSRNHQCTCMALTFLAYHAEGFNLFNSLDLDRVLERGDTLYVGTKQQLILDNNFRSDHLTVEEMPKQVMTDGNVYNVQMYDLSVGYVIDDGHSQSDFGLSLGAQLECLSQNVTHAFFIVNPECFAVFRDRSGYFGLFDSHSRSEVGLPHRNGTAIMITFSHLSGLVEHFRQLFEGQSRFATYEFVPVSFHIDASSIYRHHDSTTISNAKEKLQIESGDSPTKELQIEPGDSPTKELQIELAGAPIQVLHREVDVVPNSQASEIKGDENILDTQHRLKLYHVKELSKRTKNQRAKLLYRERQRILKCQQQLSTTSDSTVETVKQKQQIRMYNRYHSDPAFKENKKLYLKDKYHHNLAFQQKHKILVKTYYREKCRNDLSFQIRRQKYVQERYRKDLSFQSKQKNYMQERYRKDLSFQSKQKNYMQDRYRKDLSFQSKQKNYMQDRYRKDLSFQSKQKNYMQDRYRKDLSFQSKQKNYMQDRYRKDLSFQSKQKNYMQDRYRKDLSFQSKQKNYMQDRYQQDSAFRLSHIRRCIKNRKDRRDSNVLQRIHHKLNCALKIKKKYNRIIPQCQEIEQDQADYVEDVSVEINQDPIYPEMEAAIASFRERVRHGPTYICTVCHRALFPNQVKHCKRARYTKNVDVVFVCLTGQFVHVCCCAAPCTVPQERMQEWICQTCDNHLFRGAMPPQAVANNLALVPIPEELSELNVLERQLIAKIIPFAKIVALPKGQQRAIHGSVVCVPSEMEAAVNSLPRPRSEAQLLQVKLKRRIAYKGYQHFYTVNMTNVLAALRSLKCFHPEYKNVSINENAQFESFQEEEDEGVGEENVPEADAQPGSSNTPANKEQQTPQESQEELRPGLTLDTCMQPPDIAQEKLSYGDGIFSIAPAQGNKPVGFFAVPKLEAMAFPVQFPTGQNTLDEAREVKLSPSLYFNARLFSVDTRFAKDQSYLFFAQFVTETHLATNSMSIQGRKGRAFTRDGRKISNRMLQDKDELEKLIQNEEATRFMQPLRGTPAFWESALRDLHAMTRQLGKPTFFLTFSAAEMRWPEVIDVVKAQQGEQGDFSDLDWNAKCDVLRSNPVTVMRLFEKRMDALMAFILSPAQPVGPVEDYFYRVEFQARGSPHAHMVLWIKGAPVIEEADPRCCQDAIAFIDKYITCKIPDPIEDPELHDIVTSVQAHSKNHTKSCRKGNVSCRFGYPKLPMDETTITFPFHTDTEDVAAEKGEEGQQGKKTAKSARLTEKQREAKEELQHIRQMLMDADVPQDLPELLKRANMTMDNYKDSVNNLTTGMVVMLKRAPTESWINAYNPHLLRAWNANMDIQYVLDDVACLMYMMSYISKPEHAMSEFLTSVVKDLKTKPIVNKKDEMRKIMAAYSKHREVSAQEAVVRTCSLPLKKCSRSIVFIQTTEDGLKLSLPMSRLKTMHPDADNVWMSGLPDKYVARPRTPLFERMCLAEFASEYRVVYGKQIEGKNVIPLFDGKGFIQKRTGRHAIIRFTRFSIKKYPEKYYRTQLKLYLPHRDDSELTSETEKTYEEFYSAGESMLGRVKAIVDRNRNRYEGQGKTVDNAIEKMKELRAVLNAWSTFAPEVEVERLECVAERESNPVQEDPQDEVPAYQDGSAVVLPVVEAPKLSPDFVRKMYRSLNETQASVFYAVRDWCLKRISDCHLEPFFYFISGGAGCGKSHVIKCIYQEASKILRQLPRFRDEADMSKPAVLLAAFTGTAAYNISGKTLHSLLKLPKNLKPPYQALGNTLDALRAALCNTEILIIDEISMVSKELFAYVHWRFQQIKGNKKPFGGISVLAVGDFYQLPPLGRSKPLCVSEDDLLDLWTDFQMVNLTEIMRQKDDVAFAELLNRIREKRKADPLADGDRALLTTAVSDVRDLPADTLHIFPTNKEVDRHNAATVAALKLTVVNIPAEDYRKDPRSGRMVIVTKVIMGTKRDLPDSLQAGVGARVMVLRNLDVEDGLVNGTFGTIGNIVQSASKVTLLGLRLDNPEAGQKFHKKILGPTDNLVYIERSEENLCKKGVVRRQFPMKLAFGCTAHKVQGMTMSSAVVSLKRVFEPGMAYVALSRTTSLQGLKIIDFDESKIYANPNVTTAMDSMKHASFQSTRPLLYFSKMPQSAFPTLTIVHHNTEGLSSHMEDLKSHHELRLADVLCLTETHLSGSFFPHHLQLEGCSTFVRNRQVSYSNRLDMAQKEGGGVAVYYRDCLRAEPRRFIQNVLDLEFAVIRVDAPVKALIATVYRPPNLNLGTFLPNLGSLLDALALMDCQPIVVCGDFNEDLLSKGRKSILDFFQSRGFSQLITQATTGKQTLIDHIYISQPDSCVQSGVLHTYYSYHSPVYCVLTSCVISL
ncbi:uncharacterized protein LOC144011878 [Festucalex cinctus]